MKQKLSSLFSEDLTFILLSYLFTYLILTLLSLSNYLAFLSIALLINVTFITGTANQRLYLLKILRQNGLNVKSLDCIFQPLSFLVSYAIEAWGYGG
jgi:hypothetical protein